ncbi:hypothetical protein D3C73_959450 [compost metagenome]
MIAGAYFISFAINVFLLPNKLSTGGASGIATIFYYVFNLPLGLTVMAINIPLFIFSIIKLGIKFSGKAIFTTIMLSIFLDNIQYIKLMEIFQTDLFISSIYGGLILGVGLSLLFKVGASSGGSDLLAQIIYRLTSIQSLSQILLIIDTTIILSIVLVFKDVNLGLYSIVSIFVSKKVIDVIFEGIYYTKIVTIITTNKEPILSEILEELKRGATLTAVKGAYTNSEYSSLTVIVTLPEISRLKQIIRKNDENALVYISNANEVIGHGFKQM